MTEPTQASENWRGILWAMSSVVAASIMSVAVRGASLGMDSRVLVGYRAFISLVILLVAAAMLPKLRKQIRFSQPRAHIIRGLLMAGSVQMGFYTLSVVPLAAAAILFATAPIFATIFNVLLGRETIGPRRIGAIVVGFIGTLIVIRPGSDAVDLNMIFGLGSSVMFGFALVMSRNLARVDGAFSTIISSMFFTLLLAIPLGAAHFTIPTDFSVLMWLNILVIFGILRQLADVQAYHFAQSAVLTPISYLRVVGIGLLAFVIFNEVPATTTYIGAIIIIASTLYITNRERLAKQSN